MSTLQKTTPVSNSVGMKNSALNGVQEATNNRTTLSANQHHVTDNIAQLLETLPPAIREALEAESGLEDLFEIVMDLGRIPEARYSKRVFELGNVPITNDDLDYVTEKIGMFGKDNRAGIERTLHRISCIRNRQGKVVGLTCRVGRAVYGTIDIIQDIVEAGKSILILGRPGRGKTTKLREMARILSEDLKKRVVIVDTSNEIGGDGDIPHPAIGRARRMQVTTPDQQHYVMIEAVENHMPEVIVIDEIGTEQEAFAARTIAERGVQLIGTAHGNTLENLMMNPTLSDLVGGIQPVTLSDDEARRRGTQKTVLERKAPPTFDVIIEIVEVDELALHLDVQKTVDRMLRGGVPRPEIRVRNPEGRIEVVQRAEEPSFIREILDSEDRRGREERPRGRERIERAGPPERPAMREEHHGRTRQEPVEKPGEKLADKPFDRPAESNREVQPMEPRLVDRPGTPTANAQPDGVAEPAVVKPLPKTVRLFPYGVSRSRLDRAIMENHLPAYIARDVHEADVVVALKATYKREPGKMKEAAQKHLPIYMVRSNTYAQIASAIREIFGLGPGAGDEPIEDSMEVALTEAQDGIECVRSSSLPVELAPQNSYTRRLQHQLVERYQLFSESVGVEPQRRVRILPVVV